MSRPASILALTAAALLGLAGHGVAHPHGEELEKLRAENAALKESLVASNLAEKESAEALSRIRLHLEALGKNLIDGGDDRLLQAVTDLEVLNRRVRELEEASLRLSGAVQGYMQTAVASDPEQRAAVDAYAAGKAPINAVEGFVRQILGWREYMRGVYTWRMPEYAELNALDAELPMPAFMWDADTEMNCVRQSVRQLVDHAYAHHIQRLMVLGLLSMLLGVRPYDVHRWHLSMYIDAIDWVSLPNVLGMSQYADGGIVGSKPYCASGNYIKRMSDYCKGCRYNPQEATGEDACPITTLYWDFLARNRNQLENNRRMGFQFKNLDRKGASEVRAIRNRAGELKDRLTARTYL